VKPDNILIQPDGRVKLTDFGLAKDFSMPDQELTRAASGLGTPHFMAPEQFAGAKSVDARSDIYSLAATLYNILTGKLPFDAKSAMAMIAKKEACKYTAVRVIVPGVCDRVEQAIRTALDPNPDRRPQSCLEFFRLVTGRRRMPRDHAATPTPVRTAAPPSGNRRSTVRFPLKFGSCGAIDPDIHGSELKDYWPLTIRDVSAQGIGILLARRFEPGVSLTIDLMIREGENQQVPVRVVRTEAERAGHWIHGCEFVNPLSLEQLGALMKWS
jgi:serine/threonine protein kinase